MKVKQILNERLVNSSWLQSVSYYGFRNHIFPGEEIITFKVKGNPKTYIVRGLTRKDFKDWLDAPSKGKFYHLIKNKFRRDWYLTNPFRIINYK
jgi:hypothetical protein